MTTTMNLIAKQTVGSGGASSVTFSNIPQTFTDLKVVISVRTTNTLYGETIRIKPKGSTANGSAIILRGYGSGTSSYTYSNVLATNNSLGNGATANTFASIEVYCPNYTSSNYKSFSADSVSENNATDGRQELTASLWSTNEAITSLVFDNDASYSFTEGSTFYLYGISNSTTTQATTVPYASGGDVITTDGTYWYHTFLYSGTFTPLKNLTCDYLVVAGGGAGGANSRGAGGGAGGYRTSAGTSGANSSPESPLSLTANTTYTATVGAGGAGVTGDKGSNGSNSVFSTITSTGGGAGGSRATTSGSTGGSGGGAATGAGGTPGSAGSGTANQGYAGGSADGAGSVYGTGGGGGAGSVGGSGTGSAAGDGGSGLSSSITGTSVARAGGGGGSGDGDAGTATAGGGAGALSATGGDGSANYGGGGGATNASGERGGNGGSGIVIVRYAV